ncbi:hypothetical protein TYRP_002937 [Tyrophagus putrescentiae]|nr:hypothetical protein TYRP_002937 [Tyrophagus putrescentiae]
MNYDEDGRRRGRSGWMATRKDDYENRRPKTEDRRLKTEDRRPTTGRRGTSAWSVSNGLSSLHIGWVILKYRSLKILSPLGRGADRRGRSTRTVDCLKTAKRMVAEDGGDEMMIEETGAGEVKAIAKESSLEAGQCLADVSRAEPVHWQTAIRDDDDDDDDDVRTTSALVGVCQWTDTALAALYI